MRILLNRLTSAASAAALVLSLGGCQALGIGGSKLDSASAERDFDTQFAELGAEQLAEGRKALMAGHTSAAIEAFMFAKAFPQNTAAAYNGLAVAYSRIGRADLTERFFQAAVAMAPDEDRYRANLALFYTRNGVSKAAGPELALTASRPTLTPHTRSRLAVAATSTPPSRSLRSGFTVQSPGSRLHRTSRGEVSIRSQEGKPQQSIAARRAIIEVGAPRDQSYSRRISLAASDHAAKSGKKAYPIRIQLGE